MNPARLVTILASTAPGDPMTEVLKRHRHHENVYVRMGFTDDDDATDQYRKETLDVIEKEIVEETPAIETDDGARLALYIALTSGVIFDPFTHTLVRQALAYLEARATS